MGQPEQGQCAVDEDGDAEGEHGGFGDEGEQVRAEVTPEEAGRGDAEGAGSQGELGDVQAEGFGAHDADGLGEADEGEGEDGDDEVGVGRWSAGGRR